MKVLSLFSGVGGFELGLERAGMTTVFQCERDKHATFVLSKHWPNVPRWDDITTLTGTHILKHAPQIDVVAWGSPCQDLSIAGKRAGLNGDRSGLFYQGMRIIKEIRKETNGKYPRISIWENVAGALSSRDGADFGQVLYEMDESGACFSEWRLLDAQYFGVPQRRRRVFVVSVYDLGFANKCSAPLLSISQSVSRYTTQSQSSGQSIAGETANGFGENSKQGILVREREGKAGGGKGPLLAFNKSHSLVGRNDQTLFVDAIGFSHTQGLSAQPSTTAFPTLRREGSGHAVAYDEYNDVLGGNVHHALRAGTKQSTGVLEATMAVRRLMPIECERLMGWPDDWTAGQSDGHRYQQCGNGVASPMAEWIGKQIMDMEYATDY